MRGRATKLMTFIVPLLIIVVGLMIQSSDIIAQDENDDDSPRTSSEVTVLLFWDADDLSIIITPATPSFPLSGLRLLVPDPPTGYLENLADYPQLQTSSGTVLDQLNSPLCIYFDAGGTPLPGACANSASIIRITMQEADIFWFDTLRGTTKNIEVFFGDTLVDVCIAPSCDVVIIGIEPTVTPTNTPQLSTNTPTATSTNLSEPTSTNTLQSPTDISAATATEEQAPQFTDTPSPDIVPTVTTTSQPLSETEQLAFTPVTANDDWTPVEREFELPQGGMVTMVQVPAGCFMMGSEDGDDDEQPIHEQCIDEPFWIDKFEVTNLMYDIAAGSDVCSPYSSEFLDPRNCITWDEASDFCEARDARLPTEAEWEYAARGPDNLIYPWGDTWNPDNLNWADTEPDATVAIGSFPRGASWVGALDMSGNLWEWTSSFYEEYPYDVSHEGNGSDTSERVARGGSFFNGRDGNRTMSRYPIIVGFRNFDVGFRCVRDIDA